MHTERKHYETADTTLARLVTPKTLEEWLVFQQALHHHRIELGLDRIRKVAYRLGLTKPQCPVITVAGTNGKGSCVAMLDSTLSAAGYRVGCYTSPHLLRYNERIRINQIELSDQTLCDAFTRVEQARGEITLSYFEYGTLAAMHILKYADLDVIILEVGLGGRLDAVNIWDADIAVITSIGLDHVDWLGTNRESIGYEKSGIMRAETPVVCGDPDPPRSVLAHAGKLHAPVYDLDSAFHYRRQGKTWDWTGPGDCWSGLPLPNLKGEVQLQNAATVLMVLSLLQDRLRTDRRSLIRGLSNVSLQARFQCIAGEVETILDIAHNPDGARSLAKTLREFPCHGRTHLVFGVLADKDTGGMVDALKTVVDDWYLTEVNSERAMPLSKLSSLLNSRTVKTKIHCISGVEEAYRQACKNAVFGDRVVVSGSVHAVAPILDLKT